MKKAFFLLIIIVCSCESISQKKQPNKIPDPEIIIVDSSIHASSGLNDEENLLNEPTGANNSKEPFLEGGDKNPVIVFPDFKVKLLDEGIFSYDGSEKSFSAKGDTAYLKNISAFQPYYPKMKLIGNKKGDVFKIWVAFNHSVYELYYEKYGNYDKWEKNSFRWNGYSSYVLINENTKLEGEFNSSNPIFLSRKDKEQLGLKDTSVMVPEVIDSRQEDFEVNLARPDGKLCGYILNGAIIKIQKFSNGKLVATKYIATQFLDEY